MFKLSKAWESQYTLTYGQKKQTLSLELRQKYLFVKEKGDRLTELTLYLN